MGNTKTSKNSGDRLYKAFIYMTLITLAVIILVPVAWVFLASIKENSELYGNPWALPAGFYWLNFVNAWNKANMGGYMLSSVIVTALSLGLLLVVALPASYCLARFNFKGVAITLRESLSANDNNWSAMLYTDGKAVFSKKYAMHIVDRVGGGDSFGGGLIAACLNGCGSQETIEIAGAASCLKHSIEGDYNLITVDEVKKLAGGDASGRVQR